MRHKNLLFIGLVSMPLLISCSYLQKARDRLRGAPKVEQSEDFSTDSADYSFSDSDSSQVEGLKTVYFALDSSNLSEEVKQTLNSNKSWIDSNPQVSKIIIEGHCDPLGSESYNIGLGNRRAQRVYDYLISTGVPSSKLSMVSYGEEKIFSQTDNSLNRRVNFVPQY